MVPIRPSFCFSLIVLIFFTSCTTYRSVFFNLANQDDYKKFENRTIDPAEETFDFVDHKLAPNSIYVDERFGNKQASVPLEEFLEERKNIAFLVFRRDTLLFEKYAFDFGRESFMTSFSIAKSFVSLLVGIALEEGSIQSIEEPITNYLPYFVEGSGFEEIRIKHLLNHTSGIAFNESYINPFASDVAKFYYGTNIDNIIHQLRLEEPPGTFFHYHSANTQLLSMIVTSAVGESLSDYFQSRIWNEIGTSDEALWSTYDQQPVEKAFCCFNAKPLDYAKIGKLMSQNGRWEGKQIIPKQWLMESLDQSRLAGGILGYQNQWVIGLKEYGDFMAQGLYDQYIYIMPEKEIVILSFNKAHLPRTDWVGRFRQIVDQL